MNKLKRLAIVIGMIVGIAALTGRGQSAAPQSPGVGAGIARQPIDAGQAGPFNFMLPPPMTKLEAFAAQRTVVVVKGFTDLGTIGGDDGSVLAIAAVQMSSGSDRAAGVALKIAEVTAYVDEEEIDPLMSAIDSLARLQDGAVTPLQHFDARYQTGGAVEVSNVSQNGGHVGVVRIMEISTKTDQRGFASAQFSASRLGELNQRLATAKDTLARAKAAPAQPSK
jgi:hypothetical protein